MLFIVATAAAVFASGHALLHKREPRAAMGWIGFCLSFPLVGPVAYFLFGVNRIRTRAKKLHDEHDSAPLERQVEPYLDHPAVLDQIPHELTPLARISDAVSRHELVSGNRVEMLHNGEEVYPAMLRAIAEARETVLLASYIFDADETGRQFVDALAAAVERGVSVHVLLDGYGEIYSSPRAGKLLRRHGVQLALFIPPKLVPPTWHVNLRSHRKILAVDGRLAFVGGMNIGNRHLAARLDNPSRVIDLHFCLTGPVVTQIARIFCEDWEFATHKSLEVPDPAPGDGEALCRTITDGPNEDLDRLGLILLAAVSAARRSVRIMTPYFLPSREMTAALQAAALRGVDVEVFLPGKNNLPYVHWAMRNMLWELLLRGVTVYYQPPPFVHSKLFLIDDRYAVIGSSNLDPRSLRLNFELAVEIFDDTCGDRIAEHFDHARRQSRQVSLGELERRHLAVRLRDAFAWLFSPYL